MQNQKDSLLAAISKTDEDRSQKAKRIATLENVIKEERRVRQAAAAITNREDRAGSGSAGLTLEIQHLTSELSQAHSDVILLQAESREQRTKASRLEDELRVANQKNIFLESEIRRMETQVQLKVMETSRRETETQEAETRFHRAEDCLHALQLELSLTKEVVERQKADLSTVRGHLAIAEDTVRQQQEVIQRGAQELDLARKVSSKAQQRQKQLSDTCSNLRVMLEGSNSCISKLKSSTKVATDLQASNPGSGVNLSLIKEELLQLRELTKQLQIEKDSMKKDKVRLQARLQDRAKLEDMISLLQIDLETAKQNVEHFAVQAKQKEEEREIIQQEKDRVVAQWKEDCTAFQQALHERELENEQCLSEIANLQTSVTEHEQIADGHDQSQLPTSDEFTQTETNVDAEKELREALMACKGQLATQIEVNKAVRDELAQSRDQAAQYCIEAEASRRKLRAARAKLTRAWGIVSTSDINLFDSDSDSDVKPPLTQNTVRQKVS